MASRRSHPLPSFHGPLTYGSLLLLLVGTMLLTRAQTEDWRVGAAFRRQLRTLRDPARSCTTQSQPEKVCQPGRKPQRLDENLVLYQEWELDACVDAALLEANMDRLNELPFTYQQLSVFKCKLDQLYPLGYPESLIGHLGYFFLEMTPEDIHKWNVTSLQIVKSLLIISKGMEMDAQVAALVKRYMVGNSHLDSDTMQDLAAFLPFYTCSLSPELLGQMQESVIRKIKPQHLEGCSPQQMDALYLKARLAFQHLPGPEYLLKIQPYLGRASTEDLRDFIRRNLTINVATMKLLQPAAVKPLTILELQRLLGPNLPGLKTETGASPIHEWIISKPQSDLDVLGLGIQGGIPNGYLNLHLPDWPDVRGRV